MARLRGQTAFIKGAGSEFAGGTLGDGDAERFAEALSLGRLITPEDVGIAATYPASPKEAATITRIIFRSY